MKFDSFQFTDPKVKNICFQINDDFDEAIFENLPISNAVSKEVNEEHTEASVTIRVEVGERSPRYPFYITAELCAAFKWDVNEESGKESAEEILEGGAPELLLSYVRPLISLITSQSGYPALNIPCMNNIKNSVKK